MKGTRAFRAGALIVLASVVGTSMAQGSGPATAASGSRHTAGQSVERSHSLVVVPAAVSMSTEFAKGCWVRLYDGRNFQGQELMLVGPLRLSTMGTTSPWWRRWNSAIVGPNARVTVYSGGNYEGRSAALAARQRAADLGGKEIGWSGKIESTQVECSAG